MKKFLALTSALALSAVMLTGCASKLEGRWTLTDKDGEPTNYSVKFKEDDKVILNGHKGKWEQVDKNTIKFKGFDDDSFNGKFTFDIVNTDENYIYIENVAEYIEESGHEQLYRTTASTLYKAVNTALVELDEEGYYTDGPIVLSSDSSLEYGDGFKDSKGKAADMDYFYEKLENYFDEYEDYEFAVYIDSGMYCMATAVSGRTDSTVVGTYPGYTKGLTDLEDPNEEIYETGEFTLEDAAEYYTEYAEENDKD